MIEATRACKSTTVGLTLLMNSLRVDERTDRCGEVSRQLRMMMNQKRLQSIYYQNELLQGFDKNRKNKKCQSEMLQPQKIKLEKEVLKDEK